MAEPTMWPETLAQTKGSEMHQFRPRTPIIRSGARVGRFALLLCLLFMLNRQSGYALDLGEPQIRVQLTGPMGRRLQAITENWLIPATEANPGMLEMMRLRNRRPPYEDPVPWAGEFAGKYLTSCVLACRLSEDSRLHAITARVARDLMATQAEDGYLGPFPDKHLMDRWDLWGHYHCMLGLYLWYKDTGDTNALRAVTRAADLMCLTFLDTGKRVHDAGSHEMNMSILHILGVLYRETGKPEYLRLLREVEVDWQKPPAGDYHRLASTGLEFFQTPKPRWESLHPMLGLAELYRVSGETSYRDALVHWWQSIRRTDVHNSGSFSCNEQAVGNPFQPGAIETCCTVAWLALSVEALRLTGDPRIADALELATWNAVLGCEHPSGRWCTYDTPMNGKRLASAHSIVFQSRPGTPELNCCSVNGPNGLGLISRWAVLGGTKALYLNYYGAGRTKVRMENGSDWEFVCDTDYPVSNSVLITVKTSDAATTTLFLRIPEWSRQTTVEVNGDPVKQVEPGTYLPVDRQWRAGDTIALKFDFRVRALRGDRHVQFDSSLLRGPLLLAFDQKYNDLEPDKLPDLDLASLSVTPLPTSSEAFRDPVLKPIFAGEAKTSQGGRMVLCDFASAGAYGTYYRSWLPVRNAPPAPFYLQHPEAKAELPLEAVPFAWSPAEPGATYDLRIARDTEFKQVLLERAGLQAQEFRWTPDSDSGGTYYWQISSRQPLGPSAAVNGPLSFTLNPKLATSLLGTVLRAGLAGSAEPQEGRFISATDVLPALGRDSRDAGALGFNGRTSRLTYDAPRFPLRTYTFAAWFKPEELKPDGRRWHQIVSAWCAPMSDPLRVSVQDQELVLSIEQPAGGCRISGGRVANGSWTHVAVVKNFTEITLFVDGKVMGQSTVPATFVTGPKTIGIGSNPNYADPESFRGALAEVTFTREALSADAVRALANAP